MWLTEIYRRFSTLEDALMAAMPESAWEAGVSSYEGDGVLVVREDAYKDGQKSRALYQMPLEMIEESEIDTLVGLVRDNRETATRFGQAIELSCEKGEAS